jgi:signal recognition particle subunit SRP54
MMPGVPKELKDAEIDERQLLRVEAIVRSMTPGERADPTVIDGSRRARIATGSGTEPGEVSQLIKQFREMQKMMKRMPGMNRPGGRGRKGKGGKGQKGGGRVTPRGTGPKMPKQPFTLPGMN